jgi:hypothetical protein
MISIIPEYRNRNLLVKWINSHQHHTCVYMGTVLFSFSYIIEQSKAPDSASQSSPTHVLLFLFVTHREYRAVLHFPILTQCHASVSIYPRMEILSLPIEPNKIESGYCTHTQEDALRSSRTPPQELSGFLCHGRYCTREVDPSPAWLYQLPSASHLRIYGNSLVSLFIYNRAVKSSKLNESIKPNTCVLVLVCHTW